MTTEAKSARPDADWFVGIDAGATQCRARLRDRAGASLAEAVGGPANSYVDFGAAVTVLRATLDEVIAKAGLAQAPRENIALGVGAAGLTTAEDGAALSRPFEGLACVRAANDAVTACLGAHEGGDGGLIIAGTGSAAILRTGESHAILGGRGFLLGDDGSGARIGADALRASLRAADGIEPATALTRDLLGHFHDEPNAMTRWALTAKPGDYGAFAPRVFAHAADGDALALRIVFEAARAIAALAQALEARGATRIALVGGVGEALRRYFPPPLAARLVRPRRDAVDGAILLVGGAIADREGEAA